MTRAKPESTIISQKSGASNLIVLVESEIEHEYIQQNNIFKQFFEKKSLGRLLFRYLSRKGQIEISSRVVNQITAFAIVYSYDSTNKH